jgi:predicted PurR-regulated permease PerM
MEAKGMTPRDPSLIGFRVLLTLSTIAFLWLISPYLGPILWAIVAAMLFAPLNDALLRRWPGRRNVAAILTLLAVIAAVVIPALLLGSALIQELSGLAARVRGGDLDVGLVFARFRSSLPPSVLKLIGADTLTDLDAMRSWLAGNFATGLQNVLGRALNLGQSAFGLVLGLGVMLYLSFFFIKDGRDIVATLSRAVPLDRKRGSALLARFVAVVRATIKGSLVVAAAQGLVGGMVFWAIGVHAPLLWGVAMAFMSLLPAIGTGIVWVPVAIYLLATGALWQGLVLVFCGFFVIGLVDNLLRPFLVGRDTKMPDYLVFVSTLGGLQLFGFNGVVLGPVIAGLFLAAWQLHVDAPEPRKPRAAAKKP